MKDGNDQLAQWAKEDNTAAALLLGEAADPTLVSQITEQGYADDLTDDEIVKVGRVRLNRHIPDVCDTFGMSWFSVNWIFPVHS